MIARKKYNIFEEDRALIKELFVVGNANIRVGGEV